MNSLSHGWIPEGAADRVALSTALLPLAVTRTEPLLRVAGLPTPVVNAPMAIQDGARNAIAELGSMRLVHHPSSHEGKSEEAAFAQGVAAQYRERVATSYGDRVAAEVVDWLLRHELDYTQRNSLAAWSSILIRMSRLGGQPQSWPILEPTLAQAVRRESVRAYGPAAEAALEAAIQSAQLIPLSEIERRLVAIEVSQPGDAAEWDVVESMEAAATAQAAFQALQRLKARVAREGWQSIVGWARAVRRTVDGYDHDWIKA